MQPLAPEGFKSAFVYIYRQGTTTRFKVGKALDVDNRTRRSLRNVDPTYNQFDRIEVDAEFVFACETYLKNRLESKRVSGTKEVFEASSTEGMSKLIEECRVFFAEYVPLQRAVALVDRQTDDRMLPPSPQELKTFTELAVVMERERECYWQIQLLQNRLKAAIGTSGGLEGLVTWQTSKPGDCFDIDAFKANHPDLFERYRKSRATVRPLNRIFVGD